MPIGIADEVSERDGLLTAYREVGERDRLREHGGGVEVDLVGGAPVKAA